MHVGGVDQAVIEISAAENRRSCEQLVLTAVASVDLVILADLVIELYVKLPGWKRAQHYFAEVRVREHRIGHVRFRIQLDDGLADRIDLVSRNHVGRFKLASGIAGQVPGVKDRDRLVERQQFGKISFPHQIRRHKAFQIYRVVLASLLNIEEEECLIPHDGTAYSKAVLVAYVIGLLSGVKKVAGIELRTLSVPPAGPVELIAALPEDHVYNRAAVVAILGGEAVVLNFEFLNDLNGRLIVDVRIATLALFRRAERAAIEPHFRRCIALAVGNEVRA